MRPPRPPRLRPSRNDRPVAGQGLRLCGHGAGRCAGAVRTSPDLLRVPLADPPPPQKKRRGLLGSVGYGSAAVRGRLGLRIWGILSRLNTIYGGRSQRQKNFAKNSKKCLQIRRFCGMIVRRECERQAYFALLQERTTARYAMTREVAAGFAGFSAEYVRFQTGRQEILHDV